jgi:hypothetical protein
VVNRNYPDGTSVEASLDFVGSVLVTYHVGTAMRGWIDGTLQLAGLDKGSVRGTFDISVPEEMSTEVSSTPQVFGSLEELRANTN